MFKFGFGLVSNPRKRGPFLHQFYIHLESKFLHLGPPNLQDWGWGQAVWDEGIKKGFNNFEFSLPLLTNDFDRKCKRVVIDDYYRNCDCSSGTLTTLCILHTRCSCSYNCNCEWILTLICVAPSWPWRHH